MKRYYEVTNGRGYLIYHGLEEVCQALAQCGTGRDWPELDNITTDQSLRLQSIRNNPRLDRVHNFAQEFGLSVNPRG